MKKIKAWIQTIKNWYNSLTANEGEIQYSLSDTIIFWFMIVFVPSLVPLTYLAFELGIDWKLYAVFVGAFVAVLIMKHYKYIHVKINGQEGTFHNQEKEEKS